MLNWARAKVGNRPGPGGSYPGLETEDAVFAVGDIHGRLDLLEILQARIDRFVAAKGFRTTLEVYLGDYVDRGADSAGVIDRLIERMMGHRVVCLEGNHEALFLEFLDGTLPIEPWLAAGGAATAMSYGVEAFRPEGVREALLQTVPLEHLDFLRTLPTFLELDGYLFVHAGIRPGVPMALQAKRDMIWIREEFLNYAKPFGPIVVHGHSPTDEPALLTNRINLDTGAFATGRLSCLVVTREGASLLP